MEIQKDLNHLKDSNLGSLKSKLTSDKLVDVIAVLEKFRPRRHGKRELYIEKVFSEIGQASNSSGAILEHLVFKRNTPPDFEVKIEEMHSAWIEISYYIFSLNPILSPNFASELLEICISKPTKTVFCVSHSDVVSILMSNHSKSIDYKKCADALTKYDDSRSLYAIKAIRFCENWESISETVFDSLLSSKFSPKRAYAIWLLQKRSNAKELKFFSSKKSIPLPGDALDTQDCNLILKAICN
jgi:hypothetical protein